jgi:hypothetical protein
MPKEKTRASAAAAAPSPIVIHKARLSFIWAEVLPPFLEQPMPKESPLAFLTRNFLFRDMFQKALNGEVTPTQFEPPWIAERKQQFWMRYLVQSKLGDVPGSQAWDYLVPLRVDSGIKIEADWLHDTNFIDAFYYPFGEAVVLTFRWEPKLLLKDLLPKAYDFYKTGKFSLVGDPSQSLSLEEVADAVLTSLRKNALGDRSQTGRRTKQAFSLITIIEAEGVPPQADVRKNPEILKALEVLTNWPADYEYLTLPTPKDVCLPTKRSVPPGSALYAQERGRAVWHPALFRLKKDATVQEAVDQGRRSSKLGCYHRNLLFASLQTESLGRLICHTADLFNAGQHKADLTAHHRDVVHSAALCLSKLYLGDKSKTWRSASVQRQIDQSCYQELQTVLAEFSEPRLP